MYNQDSYLSGKNKKILVYASAVIMILVICSAVYKKIKSSSPQTYENVWIVSAMGKLVTVTDGNSQQTYEAKDEVSENIYNVLGSITLENGIVTRIQTKSDKIGGKLTNIVDFNNEKYLEVEGYGRLNLTNSYRILSFGERITAGNIDTLFASTESKEYILEGDKVCAILVNTSAIPSSVSQDSKKSAGNLMIAGASEGEENQSGLEDEDSTTGTDAQVVQPLTAVKEIAKENVRVLIKNSGYEDIFHKKVVVSSSCELKLTNTDNDKSKTIKAGQKITFDNGKIKSGDDELWDTDKKIVIESTGDNGRIKLDSVSRSEDVSYRGKIYITKKSDGYIVVNELDIEDYLCGVIPSEMPESYGSEALKVQAVCARTYTYKNLTGSKYKDYDAQIDDSSYYQVYNNTQENNSSNEAISATKGQVMTIDGNVILAYFCSTTCGYTCNSSDMVTNKAGKQCLTGSYQTIENVEAKDMSNEKIFSEFIQSDAAECFEHNDPWFRWSVNMSDSNITKSINKTVAKKSGSNKKSVQVLKNGEYISKKIDTIGDVKNIKIGKREKTGLILELIIEGSKETVKVTTQNSIRSVVAPLYDKITKHDGSTKDSSTLIPSAFFTFEHKDGMFYFVGGGYGHGTGMSQSGTRELAKAGKNYQDILKFFYKGIDIN